jgi:PAS domain S-box-containing protein
MKGGFMRCDLPVSNDVPECASKLGPRLPVDMIGDPNALDEEFSTAPAMNRINRTLSHGRGTLFDRIHIDDTADRTAFSPSRHPADAMNEASVLHQAEDNFAAVFRANPSVLCIIQLSSLLYREINDSYARRTGYSRSEVLGKPSIGVGLWSDPDDRDQVFEKLMLEGSLHGYQGNFRTKAGEPFITLLSAQIIEFDNELCALIVAEDITKHRQAEEARMTLIRRLVNTQEVERTRVARELHDSIGQSLALFGMELEAARQTLKLTPDGDEKMKHFCVKIKNLGHAVGTLSHQLHSSELELLGLVVAIKGLCREFTERYNIRVDCVCSDLPKKLGADVSLGLFRVVQEALHNVAKHSQAKKVAVEIRGVSDSVYLNVSDDGIGFVAKKAAGTRGLGLTSMSERIFLIRGELTITSTPGAGTRIEAHVPQRQHQTGR